MNADLVKYIEAIIGIRRELLIISKVDHQSELLKIWARWIITHRSLFRQGSLFLPDDMIHDTQFIQELIDKGCPVSHANYVHDWIWERTSRLDFNPVAELERGGIHGTCPIKGIEDCGNIRLECESVVTTIRSSVYHRLTAAYNGLSSARDTYILLISVLYGLLDGKGLQWAVPPSFLNFIRQSLDCSTELFASPVNHHYDKYYSLFDIDRLFGSRGNFFTAPDDDFVEGCFQVNPPFIDSLFTRTTNKVISLLEKAERAGKALTFVYIMPLWDDFLTYTMVSDCRFCARNVKLNADRHYYYEYNTESYIKAKFNTSVVILSTQDKISDHINDLQFHQMFGRR
jgi:hypothetical protein